MPWSRKQIIKVQIYRRAAGLAEGEYRHLLKTHVGTFSSREKCLTQWHFDIFMPVMELKVDEQIHQATPAKPLPKQISNLHYWRSRCPKDGGMTTRQRHKIFAVWKQLEPLLPEKVQQSTAYMAQVAQQATGYRIGDFWGMKAWQANLLIEALKDRLRHAVTRAS